MHAGDELLVHRAVLRAPFDAPREKKRLPAIRVRHELHIDAFLTDDHLLLCRVSLELPEDRLGRADDARRPALTQELEVVIEG
jgi:hypothetical protein